MHDCARITMRIILLGPSSEKESSRVLFFFEGPLLLRFLHSKENGVAPSHEASAALLPSFAKPVHNFSLPPHLHWTNLRCLQLVAFQWCLSLRQIEPSRNCRCGCEFVSTTSKSADAAFPQARASRPRGGTHSHGAHFRGVGVHLLNGVEVPLQMVVFFVWTTQVTVSFFEFCSYPFFPGQEEKARMFG